MYRWKHWPFILDVISMIPSAPKVHDTSLSHVPIEKDDTDIENHRSRVWKKHKEGVDSTSVRDQEIPSKSRKLLASTDIRT